MILLRKKKDKRGCIPHKIIQLQIRLRIFRIKQSSYHVPFSLDYIYIYTNWEF